MLIRTRGGGEEETKNKPVQGSGKGGGVKPMLGERVWKKGYVG